MTGATSKQINKNNYNDNSKKENEMENMSIEKLRNAVKKNKALKINVEINSQEINE